jgi:hypothetical protein
MKRESQQQPQQELQDFLRNIPAAHAVRLRLERNMAEAKLLRRVLRMAVEAEQVRSTTVSQPEK